MTDRSVLTAANVRMMQETAVGGKAGVVQGLSSAEAARRLADVGPNEIAEQQRSTVLELLVHFWGPIPWMIEAAVVLTAAVGRWADFGIILVLLLMNGLIGFWEEHQAGNAIAALKSRLAISARVLRDGRWQSVPARTLVPGDAVHVDLGQIVPADARVREGSAEVDQSTLTGESLPAAKKPDDVIYSGSVLARGELTATVTETGARTSFGRTAALAGAEPPPSHFQRAVLAIGRYLIILALSLVAVIVVVSLLRGVSVSSTLEFALVVTIASVPVALPAVLSVTMAIGSRTLARHHAVVSHLPAVEELAGVDVLCADKTGTLTQNRLTVAEPAVLDAAAGGRDVLVAAALASREEGRDPIDLAILEAAGDGARAGYAVVEFEPFDPERKRARARVRGADGRTFEVAKGAAQSILELLADPAADRERLDRTVTDLAGRGYRALAVGRDDGGGWRLLGVLALHDPARDDSRSTIQAAEGLGVEVKMVTGDRAEIAREVAGEVGLGKVILDATELEDGTGESALAGMIDAADGFAQVVPEDKYRIVKALQAAGRIVAMTGDGVNDAPALRRADAGIAVAGATEAARAAADIVLLEPGVSVIVTALRLSREIFRRMTNYAVYRITETIRVVVFVTVAILALGFFPVTPAMIVLLAVLNDAAILTIAYDNVRPSSTSERWEMRDVMVLAAALGLVGVVESFGLLVLGDTYLGLDHATLRTLMYLKLSIAGHLTLFVARTRGPLWSVAPARILLLAVIGTQILATLIATLGILMHPLPWRYAALCWGYALVWMLLLDRVKLAVNAQLARHPRAAASSGS
jgi:H+-transporting ATPase